MTTTFGVGYRLWQNHAVKPPIVLLLSVLSIASNVVTGQITEGTSRIPAVLLPRFAEFKAPAAFRGKPAVVDLTSREARRLRTVLREGAQRGPNFAGHYTIVEWGCGTECWQAAIVDAQTGKVYPTPLPLTEGIHEYASAWLHFKIDSRLLIACTNCRKWAAEQCDQLYFLWDGQGFTEIKRNPNRDPHSH